MAASPWLQLSFDLEGLDPGAAQETCEALGALSVTLSDAGDQPVLEPLPGTTPVWPETRLAALFESKPGDPDGNILRTILADALGVAPALLTVELLAERDWDNEWRKDLRPICFGQRLWICPDGQRPTEREALCIDLDPGLAFGTGNHPTTALSLEWLARLTLDGRAVIDFGCGSGILALAAARLGACQVWATDIDPQALQATSENAARNGLAEIVHVVEPDDLRTQTDILVANILANPLRELAPRFASLVKGGGRLALAGLLQEQVESVLRCYRDAFEIGQCGRRDDWALLAGQRLTPVAPL